MKPWHVIVSVAAVASVGAVAAVVVPAIVDRLQDDGPASAPDAPALDIELSPQLLAAMQRDLGLSEQEARDRLHLEAWAGQTAAALQAELGEDRYAGAWLSEDGTQLMVAVTDEDAADQVRAAGAEPALVPRGVAYLEQVMVALNDRVEEVTDALAGWHVEVASNTVVVHAPPEAEPIAERFAQEAGPLNEVIKIVISDEEPALFDDVRGGDPYVIANSGLCSVGFAVVGGFVTAGHCAQAGVTTTDIDGVPQGEFVAASFPGVGNGGSDDWAVVAVNENWTPRPVVNDYNGGTLPVAGSIEAPVGASVCRYGATTGVSCGVIEAKDATVIYPEGTITGLTRTTACGEPGDSGGAWLSGDQAQGVTSGGSGDCTSGGVAFFQPLNEVLQVNNLTLVTTGGNGEAPPPEPEAPAPAPADSSCHGYPYTFQGQLVGPDPVGVEPSGRYYRTVSAGTHTVCLAGPSEVDFDLVLQQWDGSAWQTAGWQDGPTAEELLTVQGEPGYYRIGIVSDGDTGGYVIGLDFRSG